MAKGMGNGFPVGGVLIQGDIKPWSGMLGTTFGGNYLASAACMAVLEVMEKEKLLANTAQMGAYLMAEIIGVEKVQKLRGRGLMIGFDLPDEKKEVRSNLLFKHRIFVGEAKPNAIRLLPSLALNKTEIDIFIAALKKELP
jgi:acetylornithine aminotransferase